MEDLVQVLSQLPMITHPNLLVGTETGDDAAVYRINQDTALILTVDFFTPITDDPYDFGTIAAANSLSDVYAMGGRPLLALNVVGFPADLARDMLGTVLRGGYDKAAEAGCLIAGGHTVDDSEPKYGLSVVGLVEPGTQVTNAGARPGDILVLTKPIGTGIITTGCKQGKTDPVVLQAAVDTMATLNKAGVRSNDDGRGQRLHRHHRLRVDGPPPLHGQGQQRERPHPLRPGPCPSRSLGPVAGRGRSRWHSPQFASRLRHCPLGPGYDGRDETANVRRSDLRGD